MRTRFMAVALLAVLASASGAQAQAANKTPPASIPQHSNAYCGVWDDQCRAEAAFKARYDSLVARLASYESGAVCKTACQDSINKLVQERDAALKSLRNAQALNANMKAVAQQQQPPRAPAGRQVGAVTRSTSPDRSVPISGKDQPRTISRIDSVRVAYAVRDSIVWRTRYDTVYNYDRTNFVGGPGKSNWLRNAAILAGAGVVGCSIWNHKETGSWKPVCFRAYQRVTIR